MRLLLFSDLHCDVRAAQRMVQLADQADVVVGAGDFATMRRGLNQTLDVLRQIKKPTVVVPGNSESLTELQAACEGWEFAHVLHGCGVTVNGVPFYGLGAAVPVTPFGAWSYDLSEGEADQLLADCPAGAVLVTHSPPHGIVDRSSAGTHLGSVSVRAAIERTRPRLVVCGHIHESSGRSAILGTSPVLNVGPKGMFYLLDR